MIPTTRGSRRHSATSASPKTVVYWGGGALAGAGSGRRGDPAGDRAGLGRVPALHPLLPAVLGRAEALALDRGDVDDHRTLGGEGVGEGDAQGADVVAVDHAGVGPVELLPPEAGGPEGLDRLLQLRAQALEAGADARELLERALDVRARVPELGVEAHAVEVPAQGADVRGDRHAVVVEDDDHRRAQAAGLVDRLEGDPAGHRPVADHGDDASGAELAAPAHALLDPDGVADRGRGVAGAHDVVL